MNAESRLEVLRRSAAMAPLSPASVDELFSIADQLVAERRKVRELLVGMPADFGKVRAALNELAKVVGTQ